MPLTRRTFSVSTIVSLLSVVAGKFPFPRRALGIGHSHVKQIVLQDFCDKAEWSRRYMTVRPFVHGRHLYATDCRAAVRMPTQLRTIIGPSKDEPKLPPIWSLDWPHRDIQPSDWQPWPAADYRFIPRYNRTRGYVELASCPVCDERPDCQLCGGYAEYCSLPGDRSAKCPRCKGTAVEGGANCRTCGGKREGEFPIYQLIGRADDGRGRIIHCRYHERIARLPEVRWWVDPQQDRTTAIYFLFGAGGGEIGEGIVMPIEFTDEELVAVYGVNQFTG